MVNKMKRFFSILVVICCVLTLCGCFQKTDGLFETTQPQVVTTIVYVTPSAEEAMPATDAPVYETVYDEPATQAIQETITNNVTVAPPAPVPSATTVQESTTMGKTGEMAFSDDPNNKYISAVAAKYGVSAEKLVALYTVPDNDSNIVLEFDGTKDGNGKLIRNEDTLVAIYSIDLALNSKCASKDSSKNEYPYGEMMVMFMTTTKYIMPEFEGQL